MLHTRIIEARIYGSTYRRVCEVTGPIDSADAEQRYLDRMPAHIEAELRLGEIESAHFSTKLQRAAEARIKMLRLAAELDEAMREHEDADTALAIV